MCVFLLLRFLIYLKGPEAYLHLSPLNQTLVSSSSNRLLFLLLTHSVPYLSLLASAPKGEGVKVPVKILLHHSGDLAAKFPYNQVIFVITSLHVEVFCS